MVKLLLLNARFKIHSCVEILWEGTVVQLTSASNEVMTNGLERETGPVSILGYHTGIYL
jgi:hypothetical protein